VSSEAELCHPNKAFYIDPQAPLSYTTFTQKQILSLSDAVIRSRRATIN